MLKKIKQWLAARKSARRRRELFQDIRAELEQNDDILSPGTKNKLDALASDIWMLPADADLKQQEKLLNSAEKSFREITGGGTFAANAKSFFDVVLVAVTVAFGIRALFLQPFQIPTGSMQPTLFGIHYIDRAGSEKFSSPLTVSCRDLFCTEVKIRVPQSGIVPPDHSGNIYRYLDKNPLDAASGLKPGDIVCDGWLSSGDHLFVDRLSLHFKELERGEIFIFNTEGLTDSETKEPLPGYFYIKRIAGMPGDTLKIENNVLMVKPAGAAEFKPVYELSPRFSKLYSGKGGYQGHMPMGYHLANGKEFVVEENHFFALGDNTANSLDSRYWGAVPRRNIIGRALNIFWPVSRRWGLVDEQEPLDAENGTAHIMDNYGEPVHSQLPAMSLQ